MATYEETLKVTTDRLRRHVQSSKPIHPADHIQNDLGLDSLSVMEVVSEIEEHFDVNIPTAMFDHLATVDDVARALVTLTEQIKAQTRPPRNFARPKSFAIGECRSSASKRSRMIGH